MKRRTRPAWVVATLLGVLFLLAVSLWLGQRHEDTPALTAQHKTVVPTSGPARGAAKTPPQVVFEEAGSHDSDEPAAAGKDKAVKPPAGPVHLHGMALILDDVGYDIPALRRAIALHVPMAIAILPESPHAALAAKLAHEAGHTVMLHMPMEPANPHYRKLMDDSFLREGMTRQQVRQHLDRALMRVPFVAGMNNHMGSRFTELEQPMRWVMQVCREQKLFFVDSRTNKDSVAADMAEQAGLRWGERRVFLDDSVQPELLLKSWQNAKKRLARDGYVIVIFHPHHETLDFLEKHLNDTDRAAMVPLSSVLHPAKKPSALASAGG